MPNKSTSLRLTDDELRTRFAALTTSQQIADLLDVTHTRLVWHLWRRPAELRYARFEIRKRRGGLRSITAPLGGLKLLQSKLAQAFSAVYTAGASTHGFVSGKSILTNALEHVARPYVLNVDIQDFFPSINFGRLRGLLMAWPYRCPEEVATTLAAVCFAGETQLPQGAPTSPVVANMICARMDAQLARLAQKHRCSYTRYSDDLTFSTTRTTFPRELGSIVGGKTALGKSITDIIVQNGFVPHPDKTRLQTRFGRQEVTGLVTNNFVNVRRKFIRQIRSMLHAWEKFDLTLAEREFRDRWDSKHRTSTSSHPDFVEVVAGKLSFLGMVRGRDDQIYARLVHRARKLHPRFLSIVTRDDAVLVIERQVLDMPAGAIDRQGTGFMLAGIGFVTASHVVCDNNGRPLSSMAAYRTHDGVEAAPIVCVMNDSMVDVAVTRVPFEALPSLRLGDPDAVRTGDEITLLGYPHWSRGHSIKETRAIVTGRAWRFGSSRIDVNLNIQTGNSGGPALNSRGEVIGIAVTGSSDGRHPNAIIPITAVLESARPYGIDLHIASRFRPEE